MAMPSQTEKPWEVEAFDPTWPDFQVNPYPYYDRLLRESPVHRVARSGAIWVLRHDLVSMVLQDKRFSAEFPNQEQEGFGASMLQRDPPDHTRLRALVNKVFTPRRVEALRPTVEALTKELLDGVRDQGSMDVVEAIAFPLPAIVIAELLGVPREDRERFKAWSHRIILGTDAYTHESAQQSGQAAVLELAEYFQALIAERRGHRGDDLISALIDVEEEGDRLHGPELVAMCLLLLVAGHETTANLIASGTLTLLLHPDQLARVRENPELLPGAIEEILRYESPVQRRMRFPLEEVRLGDATVRPGEPVAAVIGAANRDPEVFADPHTFDVTRSPNPHLSFGRGIHFCLGAALARMEGVIALGEIVRIPGLELDAPGPEWARVTTFRRLERLPVRFAAGKR